jgi:hypothetical protein
MLCHLCGGSVEAASVGLLSTVSLWFFRTKLAEIAGKAVMFGSGVCSAIDYAIWSWRSE